MPTVDMLGERLVAVVKWVLLRKVDCMDWLVNLGCEAKHLCGALYLFALSPRKAPRSRDPACVRFADENSHRVCIDTYFLYHNREGGPAGGLYILRPET